MSAKEALGATFAGMTDLDLALEGARRAARIIEQYFVSDVGAEMKGAVDPVTQADKDAEAAILDLLAAERPDDSILGEESGAGGTNPTAARRWYVDPLDGTVNFANRIPHCSVSIGLWEGDTPLVGVIHDVFRREVFSAASDQPARLNDTEIKVRSNDRLGDAVVVTGFPYDRQERAAEYARVVEEALRHVRGLRRMGSAALDFAWVAAGRFDAYWEYGLGPWDAAAGRIIAEQAGAIVSGVHGPLNIDAIESVVVASPGIRDQLIAVLRSVVDQPT